MERKTVLSWLGVYVLLAGILTVEVYRMSVTWDDTVSSGDVGEASWANAIISAIKARAANKVVSDTAYGDYQTDGTDDDVQIQQGIDALTAGRTWKEKVLLRGNFTVGNTIKIPDYIIIEIQGAVKLDDNVNKTIFANSDQTGGNSYIDIVGGHINGNKANQTVNVFNIHLKTVSRCRILDVHSYDSYYDGIYYEVATDSIVAGCNVEGCGDDGINVNDSSRIVVSGNIVRDQTNDGIHFGQNNTLCSITNNQIYNNGERGILLLNASDRNTVSGNTLTNDHIGIDNSDRNVIDGNVVSGAIEGIYLKNAATKNIISNNQFYNLTNWGIELDSCSNNIIQGNLIDTVTTYDGIRLTTNCDYNTIMGNYVTGCNAANRYGLSISASTCAYNIVKGNILTGNTGAIEDEGTGTVTDHMVQAITPLDLSDAATDYEVFHAARPCWLASYDVYYSEGSGAGNCNVRIGRYQDGVALDDDYFDVAASENGKNKGYTKNYHTSDLTQTDISAGDTVTVGCAGGSGAAGEVMLILKIVSG